MVDEPIEGARRNQQGRLFKMNPPKLDESRINLAHGAARTMFSPLSDETFTTLYDALGAVHSYDATAAIGQLQRLENMHNAVGQSDFKMSELDQDTLQAFTRVPMIVQSIESYAKAALPMLSGSPEAEAMDSVSRVKGLHSKTVRHEAERELSARDTGKEQGR